jgi:hypothetical protein
MPNPQTPSTELNILVDDLTHAFSYAVRKVETTEDPDFYEVNITVGGDTQEDAAERTNKHMRNYLQDHELFDGHIRRETVVPVGTVGDEFRYKLTIRHTRS